MHICFFDIDGTLILTDGAGQEAFVQTFTDEFGVGRWNGKVEFSGRSDRAIVADLFSEFGIANTEENWERFAVGYIERLPETLTERTGRILPGVKPLLETLHSRPDLVLGLLTGNIRAGSFQKLRHFGLADYFSFGGYGDLHADRNQIAAVALDAAKTHLAAIGQAGLPLSRNHYPLQSVLVIGDTPNDIRCARSIDAVAIAVATGFSPYEDLAAAGPDLLLNDLSDPTPLLSLLEEWKI